MDAEKLEELVQKVELIQRRNRRVEADKAWETSGARILCVASMTYIIIALVLWLIGVEEYWLHAIIPTAAYTLSTLSLPIIKKRWVTRYLAESQRE